jgi:ABC-type nitrate/sulfonate/bicarbonate transport system substrate-binding protein
LLSVFAHSQLTKITISYPAETPASLPTFVGKENGIYSNNGLDVQLVRIAGTVAVMALIAGEPPISQVAGPAVIASNLGGSAAVIIAAGTTATDYVLVTQKDIKIASQLREGS